MASNKIQKAIIVGTNDGAQFLYKGWTVHHYSFDSYMEELEYTLTEETFVKVKDGDGNTRLIKCEKIEIAFEAVKEPETSDDVAPSS